MGALTLKPFSDESREWELTETLGFDVTDSFGASLKLSIKENKIFLSEPLNSENVWISDRGRLFFEGAFNHHSYSRTVEGFSWKAALNQLKVVAYFLEHVRFNSFMQDNWKFFFIFKRISLESLGFLQQLEHKFSYFSIRSHDKLPNNTDFESSYQLLAESLNSRKLKHSSLAVLIGVDTRNEGYLFNLVLRQRFLKGNFNLINLGPDLNLTVPTTSFGSSSTSLLTLSEGTHPICQDIVQSTDPVLVTNLSTLKNSGFSNLNLFLDVVIKSCNTQRPLSILSDTIETLGKNNFRPYKSLTSSDFNSSSALYFYNLDLNSNSEVKKIVDIKSLYQNNEPAQAKSVFNQSDTNDSADLRVLNFEKLAYQQLPGKNLFEENSTYKNTAGRTKKVFKIVDSGKDSKSNWQILRQAYSELAKLRYFANKKDGFILNQALSAQASESSRLEFLYNPTSSLTSMGSWVETNPCQKFLVFLSNFKSTPCKIGFFKIRYWLDDFFVGGNKDSFSPNSATLLKCSKYLKVSSTNFF